MSSKTVIYVYIFNFTIQNDFKNNDAETDCKCPEIGLYLVPLCGGGGGGRKAISCIWAESLFLIAVCC